MGMPIQERRCDQTQGIIPSGPDGRYVPTEEINEAEALNHLIPSHAQALSF